MHLPSLLVAAALTGVPALPPPGPMLVRGELPPGLTPAQPDGGAVFQLGDVGSILGGVLTWTVCASGCTYTNPLAAWDAARGIVAFGPYASVVIKVADGTYAMPGPFYTDQPGTQAVHLVGNAATPGAVVFEFDHIVGTNGSAFVAERGGRVGMVGNPGIDGVTLRGTGARASRTAWADQSYGAGALALGSGSNIVFGPHVIVDGFYYGVLADQGGRFVGDGGTFRNAGDANLLSRFSSVIQCLNCTLATAAHLFTDPHGVAQALGSNALAEGSASLYVDGSTAADAQVACIHAKTNGAVWAHAVVATKCVTYGAAAQQLGTIELGRARITASNLGAYAGSGGLLNVDGLEADHNTYDGIKLDGGRAIGTDVRAHDNGGFGIRVEKQGHGEFYGSSAALRGNAAGPVFVEQTEGCSSARVPCSPASTLILN